MCRFVSRCSHSFFQSLLAVFALAINLQGAVTIDLVSQSFTNAPGTLGDSLGVQLSGDAQWALITSSAETLPRPNPEDPSSDIFLRNLKTGEVRLVSRSASGIGGSGPSIGLQVSDDGRYVLFQSDADDLVPGDTNASSDIFLYDANTDAMTLVSSNSGVPGDADSTDATMTPDGRFILFQSGAANLSTNDTNEVPDLFLYDRLAGSVKIVSSGFSGGERRPRFDASVSADGRYVAFLSAATNTPGADFLTHPLPLGTDPQVYVRDMTSNALLWMTWQVNFAPGRFASHVRLSTNGYVAFASSDLTFGPAAILPSTYVYLIRIEPRLIWKLPDAKLPSGDYARTVTDLAITPDAHRLAYVVNYRFPETLAASYDAVFLSDTTTGQQQLITTRTNGTAAIGNFKNIAISPDGNTVTFTGLSTDLISTNIDGSQLYQFDRETGNVQLLSRDATARPGNGDVLDPTLSANGTTVAFISNSKNFSADPKSLFDYGAYVEPANGSGAPALIALDPPQTSDSPAGESRIAADKLGVFSRSLHPFSPDGSRVVFTSGAPNITSDDQNGGFDIFVRDLQSGLTTRIDAGNDRDLRVSGVSRDAATVAFQSRSRDRRAYWFDLNVYNVARDKDLLEGLYPVATNSESPHFGYSASLSDDGQLVAFQRIPGQETFLVRDLLHNVTTALPATHLQVIACPFSSAGKYVFLQALSPRVPASLIIDWRSGLTNSVSGTLVGSEPDDSNLLLFTANSLTETGDLYWFSPLDAHSNLLATNISNPGLSHDATVVVYNEIHPETSRTNAVYLNRRLGQITPLGVRPDGAPIKFDEPPSVSPDGRFIAFSMRRDNGLNDADLLDVYRYDRVLTNFTLLSQTTAGTVPTRPSRSPTVAADGRVVFESLAADLVKDDRNLNFDVFVARVTSVDSNHNGLEDGWELQNFGSLSANPLDDPDGDGLSNADELHAGTDPNDQDSGLRLQASLGQESATLSWNSIFGKRYQIQSRAVLGSGSWENTGESIIALSASSILRVEAAMGRGLFYRVKIVE